MRIVTVRDRPDLDEQAAAALRGNWPEFVFHDPVPLEHMGRVDEHFADFQVWVVDDGAVVAGGWGVPLRWDGTVAGLPDGYDATLVRSVEDHAAGRTPTAFSFMAAAVAPGHQKRGLAGVVLDELTRRAHRAGLGAVVAPLRPTWKSRYPTVAMAEYATWVGGDGQSIDPWIRTHQRLGATILGPAPRSMVIEGTVAEWERWADMVFPVTGDYLVPGALNVVHIDRDSDRGVYVEENLWVQHR